MADNERHEIILTRDLKLSGKLGTFGDLDTGTFKCKILERPGVGDVDDHPRIPPTDRGYDMDWIVGVHPHHPECYELRVPGRIAILVHSANVFEQLLGCLAPGLSVGPVNVEWEGKVIERVGVISSRTALAHLIENLDKKPCRLIIREV